VSGDFRSLIFLSDGRLYHQAALKQADVRSRPRHTTHWLVLILLQPYSYSTKLSCIDSKTRYTETRRFRIHAWRRDTVNFLYKRKVTLRWVTVSQVTSPRLNYIMSVLMLLCLPVWVSLSGCCQKICLLFKVTWLRVEIASMPVEVHNLKFLS
jgi:hypothetical protein